MDLITARGNIINKLKNFEALLNSDEAEIDPADFKIVMDAYWALDKAIKDQLTEPREVTPQYFDMTQNHYERVEQFEKVEQQDLVIRQPDSWLELENGDFLNIERIDFLSKEKKLILFSSGQWSKDCFLADKDIKKIRYILQTKRFK